MPSPVPLIFKNVIMDLYMIHVRFLHVKNNNSSMGVSWPKVEHGFQGNLQGFTTVGIITLISSEA